MAQPQLRQRRRGSPAARARGSFCTGVTSCRCAGAHRPCCTARRRSPALLREPPQVHARGVGQVASHQTIELIVPILKDWHSVVGKKKKRQNVVGTACKGNTDAFKSHSPCNHRLLARRLPPQLVQYTEEELSLSCFLFTTNKGSLCNDARHLTWKGTTPLPR